jgi:hypothetical protein
MGRQFADGAADAAAGLWDWMNGIERKPVLIGDPDPGSGTVATSMSARVVVRYQGTFDRLANVPGEGCQNTGTETPNPDARTVNGAIGAEIFTTTPGLCGDINVRVRILTLDGSNPTYGLGSSADGVENPKLTDLTFTCFGTECTPYVPDEPEQEPLPPLPLRPLPFDPAEEPEPEVPPQPDPEPEAPPRPPPEVEPPEAPPDLQPEDPQPTPVPPAPAPGLPGPGGSPGSNPGGSPGTTPGRPRERPPNVPPVPVPTLPPDEEEEEEQTPTDVPFPFPEPGDTDTPVLDPNDGTLVAPLPLPVPTTPPGQEITPDGPIGEPASRPRADLASIARELGKQEQKQLQLLNRQDNSPSLVELLLLVGELLELLNAGYPGGQYELHSPCLSTGPGSESEPQTVTWPGGAGRLSEVSVKIDALAALVAEHKKLKGPACLSRKTPVGSPVTVQFEEK